MPRTAPAARITLAMFAMLAVIIVPLLAPLAAQGTVAAEFEKLHFRSIGPATMSGRVSDLAVYEANTAIWYVATAHGGIWKTTSNGALMIPLAQDKGLLSIGAIAVSQRNPDLVYAGSGESNNRQSTSWGDGLWKSSDGGKTWANVGLVNSKHIGRIVFDPTNDQVVFAASAGPLYGPGGDRGVFKSTDGGRTWRNVLPGNEDTGANDVVVSHENPKIMYAAMYQRRRSTCCMNGGGPGSGVYKSLDGGETWARLAVPGFPSGALGRVGLDVFRRSSGMIFVSVEGPGGGGRGAAPPTEGSPDAPATGGGTYRSDDGGTTWRRTSTNNPRPMYFSQVRIDPNNSDRIMMGGVGLQMSVDGGRLWEVDASLMIHDDMHALWIDPNNSDHMMQGNDGGVAISYDGARTWTFIPNLPVGLFYHVGYDLDTPYNICGGMQDNYDWCGPSRSRHTQGIMNYDWFQIQGGDGFVAIPDLHDSRIVYTESQDGNVTRKNKVTGESKSIRPNPANVVNATPGEPAYRFQWDTPLMLSPNDPGQLLIAANRVFRSTDRGDSWTAISPDLTTGANRDTIVTMGLKGADITISRNDGVSQWPAIVALAESPKQAGVYYAGTDDGIVQMSKDNGKTWTNITSRLPGFPAKAYVSRVVPSKYDAGTVYVTVENHRENDFGPHVWASKDFGASFTRMTSGLAGEVTRTLTEDVKNPDVLYIGTETGIFVSIDRGQNWRRLKANFPTVRVDELTIMPRDNALLVASHGRALWVLDDLSPIQEYAAAVAASGDGKLFSPSPALQWKEMDNRNDEFWGHQYFVGENPPLDAVVSFYLKRNVPGLALRINDAGGRTIRTMPVSAAKNAAGIHAACWDQRGDPISTAGADPAAAFGGGRGGRGAAAPVIPGIPTPAPTAGYLPENPCVDAAADGAGGGGGGRGFGNASGAPYVIPGNYTVQLVANNTVLDSKPLRIVGDPAVKMADNERKRYNDVANDLHELQRRATAAQTALQQLNRQINDATPKVRDGASVPADLKSKYDAFTKEWDAVRKKFGVGIPVAAGRGGGGGGRGGAVDPENVLARVGAARASVAAFWEMPSASVMKQYTDAKDALPKAIADANAFITKANTMANALKAQNITLTVPATIK